ncbi:MAG: AAC(3) family N-acetyltransferase [Acidiferrobacterales bacterium]
MEDTAQAVSVALRAAGLVEGDTILVHSGLQGIFFALRANGHRGRDLAEKACATLRDGILAAIGEAAGTVCVPGFHYDYARRGEPFDARTSPPDNRLGRFPDYFFRNAMSHRSLCPPVSIMACGPRAAQICDTGTTFGHGLGSPWARLIDIGAKMLFWDATPAAMTFVHHVEMMVGVPHSYCKVYPVPVRDLRGRTHAASVNYVRYLDDRFAIDYDLDRLVGDLRDEGVTTNGEALGIPFAVLACRDAFDFLSRKLIADPFYLLAGPPQFVPGEIPMDGAGTELPKGAFSGA